MRFNDYIQHPERLNRDALYELRNYVALYPYNQVARLLMLKALYLLHDSSFGEELRRSALYITDRKVLFDLVEGGTMELRNLGTTESRKTKKASPERTEVLIDDFLAATTDYASYLLSLEAQSETNSQGPTTNSHIIDDFLDAGGKITIPEEEKDLPGLHDEVTLENDKDSLDEGYYTESLAKIYIKQDKYSEALEIFKRINLENPKKSVYFADQMRFLEKIIKIKNKKQ